MYAFITSNLPSNHLVISTVLLRLLLLLTNQTALRRAGGKRLPHQLFLGVAGDSATGVPPIDSAQLPAVYVFEACAMGGLQQVADDAVHPYQHYVLLQ